MFTASGEQSGGWQTANVSIGALNDFNVTIWGSFVRSGHIPLGRKSADLGRLSLPIITTAYHQGFTAIKDISPVRIRQWQ